MKKKNDTIQNCFQLLKGVLHDAFQTDVLLFEPPYGDLNQIDRGMRAMIWPEHNPNVNQLWGASSVLTYKYYVVKSNLGFYNLIALVKIGEEPTFITVGPFRDEDISPHYFSSIIKKTNLASSVIRSMKQYYESIPLVPLEPIINVTKRIIAAYIPAYVNVTEKFVRYSEFENKIFVNQELLRNYSRDISEQYQEKLVAFTEELKTGSLDAAQTALKNFLHVVQSNSLKNEYIYEKFLHVFNSYCHRALLETTVHPSYILMLANQISNKISSLTSKTKLMYMPYDICHKYCLLVKNYANPGYSKITRDVMTYIRMHFDEDLSLSYLANYFQKNASTLSNTFSKDTGMSVTKFIHQIRINEAIRYFNSTSMSVSEVAIAVGFHDFTYFSRLFHKQIGCSPRVYKRKREAK